MANRTTILIFLVLSIAVLCLVSACQSNTTPPPPDKLTFKDAKSMQDMLKGCWILQEYEDSIDAGLTPKLIELMLDSEFYFEYIPLVKKGMVVNGKYNFNICKMTGETEVWVPEFNYSNGNINFHNPHDTTSKVSIAHAEFIITASDTILRYYKDSLKHKHLDFVKYDVGRCEHYFPYYHLINSKFIAGKYYLLSDTGHTHHIIFTKCGKVEGVEYILPDLKGYTEYNVQFDRFSTHPDALSFGDPGIPIERQFYWEVRKDTLRLYTSGSDEGIFLVK